MNQYRLNQLRYKLIKNHNPKYCNHIWHYSEEYMLGMASPQARAGCSECGLIVTVCRYHENGVEFTRGLLEGRQARIDKAIAILNDDYSIYDPSDVGIAITRAKLALEGKE